MRLHDLKKEVAPFGGGGVNAHLEHSYLGTSSPIPALFSTLGYLTLEK
jgi:hypothetical protein